ncbi:MAG: ribosomal protein S18-alanine N-acetyltransferase [Bacillota bacterium]
MSEIIFEPLKKSHIEGIIGIEKKCFQSPWSKEAFLKETENEIAYYIIAIENGEILGYGGMWLILDEGHITNIAVEPSRQREGIAKKIVENLILKASEEKVVAMTLEVRVNNTAAINLYKKFGFFNAGIRKNYYEDSEDALIMWRKCGDAID